MLKLLKKRKVNNLQENFSLDIDIMRTKGNVEIAKLEVENDVLNAENRTLNLRHDNILLQNENSLFGRLKSSGNVLNLLSILSFFVSTLLSLISGYMVIKNIIKFIGYALIMLVCQLIIFISARYSTVTKDKFFHKYLGLKFMQVSMMLVSLVMNILFIHECFNSVLMDVIMLPLCFILDYSTIFFSNLGHDYKTLTFYSNNENKTIIEMLVDNLTYNIKSKIYKTYHDNHLGNKNADQEEEKFIIRVKEDKPEIKQIEESKVEDPLPKPKKVLKLSKKFKNKKFVKKVDRVNVELTKNKNNLRIKSVQNLEQKYNKIKDYLRTEYKQNDYIKSFRTKFKLTVTEYRKILDKLKNENIVYTENRKTYLQGQLKAIK